MKKLIVLFLVIATVPALANDSLSTKLTQKFSVDFPQAENVKSYETTRGLEVYYTMADIKCHIWYNADGQLVKSIRYYSEKDLSPYLKGRVQQQFPAQTIFCVTELSKASGVSYHITLEDEKSWTTVVSDNMGELTVTRLLNK